MTVNGQTKQSLHTQRLTAKYLLGPILVAKKKYTQDTQNLECVYFDPQNIHTRQKKRGVYIFLSPFYEINTQNTQYTQY